MTEIGYQHGIVAGLNGLRDLDPSKTLLQKEGAKWPSLDTLASVPLDQWKAWDKMERAFTILVHDHDAAQANPPVPPVEPPAQTYKKVAPRVAYKAGSSDARYCCQGQPGVVWLEQSRVWQDDVATYDDNGLCKGGRTDGSAADCPTSALEINSRDYCQLPRQGDPTKNTGSWLI